MGKVVHSEKTNDICCDPSKVYTFHTFKIINTCSIDGGFNFFPGLSLHRLYVKYIQWLQYDQ